VCDDILNVYVIDRTRGMRHLNKNININKYIYKLKGDWHSLNLTCCKFLHACDVDVFVSIPNI